MRFDKEKAKENLSKLIEKFKKELESGRAQEYNEEATKISFIQPLLEDVLGWDVRNHDEVSPEERVSKGRVDYGLKVDGITKVFIEAKPIKADLDKHIDQAVRYGYNKKSVPFVLLTDFEGIKLFDVTVKPDSRNLLKGLKIDLEWSQYLEQFDRLWLLSKESVIKGELDKLLLVKPKDRLPVDKAILDDLKRWRVTLAKDIFKNNPELFHSGDREKDANFLKEITQRILDRIIFMRSCEDRGLTYRRPLKEIFEERTETVGINTMIFLKEEFKHYNIIFDSDLFRPKEWEVNLAVDFKVMRDIIFETYNPYQFDVIPLEVLGNIYEQYLGYTVRLTDHHVKYELKPEVRKAGGVYYTPEYIVDYIVKNTVGKLLKEISAKKIKKLRILDPACGSGSFLIRAYEEMLNYCKSLKKSKSKSKERMGKLELEYEEAEPRLTIEEKSEILRNHIFGVDIDEQAVEVTKLSLMMKILEGEYGLIHGRSILPILDRNIRCGNSLISGDILELKKYFGDKWYEVKPFNWEYEFEKIMVDEGGFDVVIGNPPYGFHEVHSNQVKQYFKENYIASHGSFEHYFIFYEKTIKLLKNNGVHGFIVPVTWLTIPSARSLRKFVLENYWINEICWLPELVFPDAKVNTLTSIIQKSPPKNVTIKFYDSLGFRKPPQEVRSYKQSQFIELDYFIGIFEKVSDSKIIQKIKNIAQPLKEVARPCSGYNPYEVGKGQDPKGGTQTKNTVETKPYHSDKKLSDEWKPEIIGRNLSRYSLNITGKRWIKYGNWLAAQRDPNNFVGERILVQEITGGKGRRIIATYYDKELYYSRDVIPIKIEKEQPHQFYLLGLINSRLITWYHHKRNPKAQKGLFPKVLVSDLKKLPIRNVDFSNLTDMKLHDDLVALVDVILDLNKKIQTAKGREKERIKRQIEKTDREIDNLVYRLYGITDEERKIIEEQ